MQNVIHLLILQVHLFQRFENQRVKVTVMVSGLNVRNSFQKVYQLVKVTTTSKLLEVIGNILY